VSENKNRFGAFTGVFTPSILTILGVIMYMRLGWVVGNSGIFAAVGIILVAHIISLTTGLSISSIATDKKIRTGGIYYILSRSLGLPMGGAIGIALFIGMSLSISLYIVGFTENFIGIEAIRQFLGLETGLQAIRVVGTATIGVLVLLAFISTSLALKTQNIVLTAIILSLVSIFLGFFTNTGLHPEQISLMPAARGVSLEVVFGVFFPAVTGFTAGVSMSGDLKDPVKAIPKGTMGAILVGLVVYLILAVSFGFFVDRELLLTDNNFLMTVALYSPLVIAGIWGATLSSALGGILGAPRILQAIAGDRLMPRFFKKGYGAGNEPRNALLLTFLIAEGGILIGDLNVIARIVSMFYIAAYGFINLAYALEKWASSDFRPSFSLPQWIGVIGFIASFAVMFQLDVLAMIIALLIMFVIYFLLKRRELQGDFGDVWQSVWATLVRDSLHRINLKQVEQRHWKPNIILFSGNKNVRKHLIDFGKALVGQHGFLSDFELVESRDSQTILPKTQQSLHTTDAARHEGVFTRREYCTDVYDCITSIAKHYGFSGVEPNAVLLGWGRHSKNPEKFASTIRYLTRLDLNIMMVDYDREDGFGDFKTIDIWWRGSNKNGHLALTIVKFLWLSNEWRNARLRLMIINYTNDKKKQIERRAQDILASMRIRAEVKVINNEIEKRPYDEIIQTESSNSDLTFLGTPEIPEGKENEFVRRINSLCTGLGTVVLIRASSAFHELDLGVDSSPKRLQDKIRPIIDTTPGEQEVVIPQKSSLAYASEQLFVGLNEIAVHINESLLVKLFNYQDEIINRYKVNLEQAFEVLETTEGRAHQTVSKKHHELLFNLRKEVKDLQSENAEIQKDLLEDINDYVIEHVDEVLNQQPESIDIYRTRDEYEINEGDSLKTRIFKRMMKYRFALTSKGMKQRVHFRRLTKNHLNQRKWVVVQNLHEQWGRANTQFLVEFRKLIDDVAGSFRRLDNAERADKEKVNEEWQKVNESLELFHKLNDNSYRQLSEFFRNEFVKLINDINKNMNELRINSRIPSSSSRKAKKAESHMRAIPVKWLNNQHLLFNTLYLEITLFSFSEKLASILEDTASELEHAVKVYFSEPYEKLEKLLARKNIKNEEVKDFISKQTFSPNRVKVEMKNVIDNTFRRIRMAENTFPEHLLLMAEDTYNNLSARQFQEVQTVDVYVRRLADYLIQTTLIAPLQQKTNTVARKLDDVSLRSQNAIKQITFALIDLQNESEIINQKQKTQEIDQEHKHLKEEIAFIYEQARLLKSYLKERNTALESALSLDSFIANIKNLRQYVREQEQQRRINRLRKGLKAIDRFTRRQVSLLWYRQSRGLIMASRMKQTGNEREARVDDILAIRNKLIHSPEVEEQIPFYYRQLFRRKQYYLNELWVNRARELSQARAAYDNYQKGFRGGLLVRGERNSGRSFFSQYAARYLAPEARIYTVYPPFSGSLSTSIFKTQLQKATDIYGSYDEIFSKMDSQAILVIDDLELWWEKSENGFRVIDQIVFLMERYSPKCWFIVNVNTHSFRVINSIKKIESYFLKLVELQPFNAEQLRDIILKRHNSSSLRYTFKNRKSKYITALDNARLFNRYFHYSQGNVGVALNAWLTNITSVENNTLRIKFPEVPDARVLDYLESDWLLIILQFVLHKRLTLQRLQRITHENANVLLKKLSTLKRAGIITESNGVYEPDLNLYPFIKNRLIEKQVL